MKRMEILALGVVALVLLVGVMTLRDDPDLLRFEVSGDRAYGYGYTDSRSVGVVKRLKRDHPDVTTLVLKRMPGTQHADANLKIARNIRRLGLNTHLEADSFIASGAVDLFLSGVQRTMECGAQIGVHSWGNAIGYGPNDLTGDERAGLQTRFLRHMGIDPAFYVFTRDAASADDLYLMSPEDVNRFDLLDAPLVCED